MSMYATPPGSGLPDPGQQPEGPKANQACASCRKQKRKCSKALPACALCARMNRPCDYSNASPPPSSDDIRFLKMKVAELEANSIRNNGGIHSPSPYNASSVAGLAEQALGAHLAYSNNLDHSWRIANNRFPTTAFLDGESFRNGG